MHKTTTEELIQARLNAMYLRAQVKGIYWNEIFYLYLLLIVSEVY